MLRCRVLLLLSVLVRSLAAFLRSRRDVALENVVLRLKGGNKPSASQAALAYQGRGDREVDGKPCPEIAGTCIVYEVTWNRDI